MYKIIKHHRTPKHQKSNVNNGKNLQRRFIFGVLFPPFVVLLLLGGVIYWQLDRYIKNQAIDELKRASSATSVRLDREFSLRQTILQRTGEDIFGIKNSYVSSVKTLEQNRSTCTAYVKIRRNFLGVPGNACDTFLPEFAKYGTSSVKAIEEGYVRAGNELLDKQNQNINDRLSAFKQFFPETEALLVTDKDGNIVSSAQSETSEDILVSLKNLSKSKEKGEVEGRVEDINDKKVAIFAHEIDGGNVFGAYNVRSESFLRDSWSSTPIDKTKSIVLILDSEGTPVYPDITFENNLKGSSVTLRNKKYTEVALRSTSHIAVGSEVGGAKWLVVVASPAASVLAPMRDAQLVAVLIIGTLIVGFLWVGAYFIQKTLKSIIRLVSGALVFSGGKLDYKIHLDNADIEFESLANTMNTMAERIAAAEKELDEKNKEFISIATHELRTPLTAIIGNLSMVYDDFGSHLDSTVKPLVEQVLNSTNRLKDLVNDMLDVARMEGGRAEFKIGPVNAGKITKSVVETLQVTAKGSNIKLLYNPDGATNVMADEAKLGIVLNNFVSNAIKYNRPNGSVTVSHSLKDNKLVTAIADTGLGIPEDQKAHMFEKFFRVQNEDRKNVVGTGLGMYITHQYVLKMGGEVWFESAHGKGTTFYFSIPLVEAKL